MDDLDSLIDEGNIEASRHDWEGFKRAARERWQVTPGGLVKCTIHNTLFDLSGPDGEPCWPCYNEFEREM